MALFRILLLLLLSTLSISNSLPDDEIDVIRQRVLEIAVWPTAANLPSTIQSALIYNRTLNSSCYWPDINYADKSLVDWSTAKHMYRITTMLQSITANGSTIKNDPEIMVNIHCALQVWLINDWQSLDWAYNQANIPLQATTQLLMLGDNATQFEIEKIKQISFRAAWWLHRPVDVGANLVWMIQSQIYRSLQTRNRTGIEQGFSRMWQDVAISPLGSEGIQYDWSYHFHGFQLLSGSYGVVWANNILLFLQSSLNTTYQPEERVLMTLANFLIEGDAWMIMTSEWDSGVVGRDIASPGNGFGNKLQTNWIRSLAQLVKSNETRVKLMNFADRLDNKSSVTLLLGNKHFFTSDFQVHRRSNWIFTIKIQSIRTQPTECINGQNQKDEHGGQGVLNLYRIGPNDYRDFYAIIDWQAINGITVEHDIPIEQCEHGLFNLTKLSFVGGVSDDQYGLAFMDTASHHLTAKRSWHFYDDAVIALATNITLTTTTTAWTTLASRLLSSGQISIGFFNLSIITLDDGIYSFPFSQDKTSNVYWIHIGQSNIAYLLPLQQSYHSIGIQLGIKTGNYDTMGPFNKTITARMVTLWIDHGVGPYTLDSNYIIVPNVSLESMPKLIQQYHEEQVFGCISTNNLFHGTIWPRLKRASFVLWDNITTIFSCQSSLFNINITFSNAGAYLFSENATDFTLTASHPTRINDTIKITVDRMGYGEGCTISSDANTTVTNIILTLPSSPDFLGASVNVSCKKQL